MCAKWGMGINVDPAIAAGPLVYMITRDTGDRSQDPCQKGQALTRVSGAEIADAAKSILHNVIRDQ
jgi:hypothetical protein